MPDARLVQRSIELAVDNVSRGGKPFACIVVEDDSGEVLVEATNQVSQSGDCTAHAEITAVRELASRGRTDLTGCTVYVTAYPCPMCLGALYYAQPESVVFAATREQESEFYEDGNRYMSLDSFYGEYARPPRERSLPAVQGDAADPQAPFRAFADAHPGD
ncbi:nucleoside deaminase [Jatrophihabitans fulvus]